MATAVSSAPREEEVGLEPAVLVVDDDPRIRRLLVAQLAAQGIACDTASDGITAFWMARRRRYSLMLVDLSLPHVNGNELISMLHAVDGDGGGPQTRFVVFSGNIDPGMEMELGCYPRVVGAFRKPLSAKRLAREISGMLALPAA